MIKEKNMKTIDIDWDQAADGTAEALVQWRDEALFIKDNGDLFWFGNDEAWEEFNFNIYTTIATRPKPKLTEITAAELLEELHKHAELNPYRDDLIGHLNAFIKKRS